MPELDCPYNPSSDRFSIHRCQRCRSTTPFGYHIRKTIIDRTRSSKQKLPYKTLYNGYYNFECPYFPWNYGAEVSRGEETISLEGSPPPKPEECRYFNQTYCEKLKVSTLTTLKVVGGRIQPDGLVPICEICLVGGSFIGQLSRLFGVSDDLAE